MGAHRQGRGAEVGPGALTGASRVVRVLPDEPAIDKTFDYLVPEDLDDQVRIGTCVRIELHGRRRGGWVVADGVAPPEGVELRPLAKVTGWGPPSDIIDLAGWAAWRWAGRRATFLRTASPDRAVRALPPPEPAGDQLPGGREPLAEEVLAGGVRILRLAPAIDPYEVALCAARRGNALVLTPSVSGAHHLAIRLRRAGVPVALHPDGWARARAGVTVVGSRAAAWAPVVEMAAAVVLDEHDEAYREERAPTWNARDVVIERCRRADVPCALVSPAPSPEALREGPLIRTSRAAERRGWPVIQVIDRRREDLGRAGLFSEAVVRAVRSGERVILVLNRRGRSKLLACTGCGELARCTECGSALQQSADADLVCGRCGAERPLVCSGCGSFSFRNLRLGVTRVREELEALAGSPVVEVSGDTSDEPLADGRILVGTEAVLHQARSAEAVVFLDFDQELLAPRFRAGEEALTLLVRAARLVGGRDGGGRILVQTRMPGHEVIAAALRADPDRFTEIESARRRELMLPPFGALAEVSGQAAEAFISRLAPSLGVEVAGPVDGRWRLRAPGHQILCDALATVERPAGRLRVSVDPARI